MNHIDRLIIKAKNVYGVVELRFSFGMVCPADGGKWEAFGQLWNYIPNGKPGSRCLTEKYICDSMDDAIAALQQLSEKYPNCKDVVIIIDNMIEGDRNGKT